MMNHNYSFTPVATDTDGDTLAFSIENRPTWAAFDTLTGALTGTPAVIESSSAIKISVSDGTAPVSLPVFMITVTADTTGIAVLNWSEPTVNTDGSPLTNLAGYTIYYGTNSSSLNNTININSPSITSYTVTNLIVGTTYYFAIASVNTAGTFGPQSDVADETL